MYSKKYKLPKSQWEKGRSKFVFIRLEENARRAPIFSLIKKFNLITWLKQLYAKFFLSKLV